MHPELTETQVRHVALLARLSLTAAEVSQYTTELGRVAEWFRQLDAVSTKNINHLAHPLELTNVFREDEPCTSLPAAEVQRNASQCVDNLFSVPHLTDSGAGT